MPRQRPVRISHVCDLTSRIVIDVVTAVKIQAIPPEELDQLLCVVTLRKPLASTPLVNHLAHTTKMPGDTGWGNIFKQYL